MTKIISIANQKGGVSKTTTAINISSFLAEAGKRVLLVDLDSQANASAGTGLRLSENDKSIYDLLTNKSIQVKDVLRKTDFLNLDIIPSHINLSGIDLELVNRMGRESVLKKKLEYINRDYDYIILDTPPALSLITVNAFVYSTDVFITVESNPLALDGLTKLYETIDAVNNELNPGIKVSGIIVTLYDSRTNLGQTVLQRLKAGDRTKDIIFNTYIRRNVKLAEAIEQGKPINYYDKSSHGYADYYSLSLEILNIN